MEYRNVGRCGLKVSEICLGTLTFGKATDQAESKRIVDLAFEAGVNFFDTADAYNAGLAEEYLGRALAGRRQGAVVASKVFNPMGPGPNDGGTSRLHIMQAVEASLKRLGMDYLDIYYVHHTDLETPIEETLRAMDDLVSQGKVRYIACSNHEAWLLMEGLWTSDTRGWNRYICYQPEYNLVSRDIEADIIPVCQYKGLGVVVWGVLAGGFLTGKLASSPPNSASGQPIAPWRGLRAPNTDEILKVLLEVSQEIGRIAGPGRHPVGARPARHHQCDRRHPHPAAGPGQFFRWRLAPPPGDHRQAQRGISAAQTLSLDHQRVLHEQARRLDQHALPG